MKVRSSTSSGRLYLVPTPLSTESEWSFSSAIEEALRSSSMMVCERIRTSRRSIKYLFDQESFDRLTFVEMDKKKSIEYVDQAMTALSSGHHVAVLSEAGLPCVADPGHPLVLAAHNKNIDIHPFSGPCSFMMALMASGLNGQNFAFHGYLSRDPNELHAALRSLEKDVKRSGGSQIFMETPYRNQKLFDSILRIVSNDINLNVSMEINGRQELIKTKTVLEWKKRPLVFKEKFPAVFILG
jgi:16S rRNA (cytidine1402-2'-O)-methyltransferase